MKTYASKTLCYLFLICYALIFSAISHAGEKSRVETFSSAEISAAIGGKAAVKYSATPIPHLKITKEDSPEQKYFLFCTTDANTTEKGLKGPVEVFVLTDAVGSVVSVFWGENVETPNYLKKVAKGDFLKKWKGKKSGDAPPDTVSGATFSSKAVNKGIAGLLDTCRKQKLFE